MYVSLCVCMYVCMSVCLSVCLSVCVMHACMHVCMYIYLYHVFYIRSESPTQAFVVMVLWQYRKSKTMFDDGQSVDNVRKTIASTCLAYDNMWIA